MPLFCVDDKHVWDKRNKLLSLFDMEIEDGRVFGAFLFEAYHDTSLVRSR